MPAWEWFGHFAVRINWSFGVLYIDPFQLREKRADVADLVLLTNPRVGHLSPEDIELVSGPETLLAGPADCMREVTGGGRALVPEDTLELPGLKVRAVPAYNTGKSFFPESRAWVGYVIEADGVVFYHAGATDRIPEMSGIRADVAFLPVSGRYVMDADEAVRSGAEVGARSCVGTYVAGDRYFAVEGFVTRSAPETPRS